MNYKGVCRTALATPGLLNTAETPSGAGYSGPLSRTAAAKLLTVVLLNYVIDVKTQLKHVY